MAKRRNNADMGIADSTGAERGNGQEHLRFDDAYFKRAQLQHQEPEQKPSSDQDAQSNAVESGCEYSKPLEQLVIMRACELSKSNCGILGWREHFKDCDLFKAAQRNKSREEIEKKGDNTAT